MNYHRILLAFSVLFTWTLSAQAMTLEEVQARYKVEVGKLAEQRAEKEESLRESYLTALLRMELNARNGSDLEGVLAAQKEIRRVEGNPGSLIADPPAEHPELRRMQDLARGQVRVFRLEEARSLMRLVENLRRFSETRSSEMTRSGDIETAVAWRNWGEGLLQQAEVLRARRLLEEVEDREQMRDQEQVPEMHPALKGDTLTLIDRETESFEDAPRAYMLGSEPKGDEKRLSESTPSAGGSGHTLLQGRLRLVDEANTLGRQNNRWVRYHHQAHMYVARVQFTPLPGQELGRTLVVFDLFKRGSGSRREILRTDTALLPPLRERTQVVVDSGLYAYQTQQHRTSWGDRGDRSTADEFYGFIVTLFDDEGNLIFQRSSERALNSHARSEPPSP